MARNKFTSPRLEVDITAEAWEHAKQGASGGCLIADAIKKAHPELSHVRVDMATIRATDSARGERYTYLTPATGQQVLLFFDQGWPQPDERRVIVQPAVKIDPVTSSKARTAEREARRVELEAKVEAGDELTKGEKNTLTKLRKRPGRPSTTGAPEVKNRRDGKATVRGGRPIVQGVNREENPNLLRGVDRHFGARVAKPAEPFANAVELEVQRRLAELQA